MAQDEEGEEAAASPPLLPVGLKFQPTDVELVDFYLRRRLAGIFPSSCLISEADVYEYAPQDLFAKLGHSFIYRKFETEMYFFTPRHPTRGPGSRRASRTIAGGSGLWDGRARDTPVMSDAGDRVIGHKVQMTFKNLKGDKREKEKTNWLMHEYRIESGDKKFVELALCRIYHKGGGDGNQEEGEENSRAAKRQRVVEDQGEEAAAGGSESNMMMMMTQAQPIWDHGASPSAAAAAAGYYTHTMMTPSSSAAVAAAGYYTRMMMTPSKLNTEQGIVEEPEPAAPAAGSSSSPLPGQEPVAAAGSESNMMQQTWDHGSSFSAAAAAAADAGDQYNCNGEHSQMLQEGDGFCIDVELGTLSTLWEQYFPGGDNDTTIDEYGRMVPRYR